MQDSAPLLLHENEVMFFSKSEDEELNRKKNLTIVAICGSVGYVTCDYIVGMLDPGTAAEAVFAVGGLLAGVGAVVAGGMLLYMY